MQDLSVDDINTLVSEKLFGCQPCAGWSGVGSDLRKECSHYPNSCFPVQDGPPDYVGNPFYTATLLQHLRREFARVDLTLTLDAVEVAIPVVSICVRGKTLGETLGWAALRACAVIS